ncbi:MAG TPA: diguanylate cyclase, partial [Tianweitania sediminis]|nr:diguanylate cyclase [Tianweitania sediminis]
RPDAFAELAALSAALGGAITIAGRNYGSRKMVMILSVTAVVPISLGLMLKGDIFNIVLGLLIFPFMFITSKIADLVRTVLFTAIEQSKRSTKLAHQFDRALNTMPDGLIMFDHTRHVVVANTQTAEALGFASPETMTGRTLLSLLLRAVAAGLLDYKEARYIEAQLARALQEKRDRKILVGFSDGRHFELSARGGSDELAVVTFEDITTRVAAEQKIQHMARYDLLTGLPNRGYFNELVLQAMETGTQNRCCAVIIFDLDDFKTINDTLGHPVGDGLIDALGKRLSALITPGTFVCRFGGDEFMLYLDDLSDEAELTTWLDAMLEDLDQTVDVSGHRIRCQMSAGAVVGTPAKDNLNDMVTRADLALYRAKELGKNGWHLFEASLDKALRERQLMRAELREALAGSGLHVVYQPIVSLQTMRIDSCEALCRWQSDVLGTVPPALFIPLAEEMGVISEITAFVLNAACQECCAWPNELSVSVNLSAWDFADGDLVNVVKSALERTGLASHRLELEITETAVLQDKGATA